MKQRKRLVFLSRHEQALDCYLARKEHGEDFIEVYPVPKGGWKNKSVFIDFDGTLIRSRKLGYLECEPDADSRLITTHGEDGISGFEITHVEAGALAFLKLRKRSTFRAYLASAGDDEFIRKAIAQIGAENLLDNVFSWEHLVRLHGKRMGVSPKSLRRPLDEIGETDPLANCVMIGDNPDSDVPFHPQGMVTLSGNMDTLFLFAESELDMILRLGNGSFAEGFDKMHQFSGTGFFTPARLIRTEHFRFGNATRGLARIMDFGYSCWEGGSAEDF